MAITDVLPLSSSVLKKIMNVVTEFNSWSLRTYFQHSEHKFDLCVYFSATNYFFPLNILRNSMGDLKLRSEMKRSLPDMSNATENQFYDVRVFLEWQSSMIHSLSVLA